MAELLTINVSKYPFSTGFVPRAVSYGVDQVEIVINIVEIRIHARLCSWTSLKCEESQGYFLLDVV